MSKPSRNTAFRKVDVDKYNEDAYEEDAAGEDNGTGPNDAEVTSLLAKNQNAEALKHVLSNPPLNTKNQAVKDRALATVMKVLLSFKTSEIEGAVKGLDQNSRDVLMKYIYRGFEQPSEGSSALLLVWHDKAYSVAGLGSIVRALTDRKRV